MDFAILVFASLVGLTLPTTINALSRAIRVDCSCRWWRLALAILAWIALTRLVLLARCATASAASYRRESLWGGVGGSSLPMGSGSTPRSMPISPRARGDLSAASPLNTSHQPHPPPLHQGPT